MGNSHAFDIYQEAVEAERSAWAALNGGLPGKQNFNQDKWDLWRTALRRSDEARKAMLVQTETRR